MNWEKYNQRLYEEIGKIVKPILDKVLKETPTNLMLVGKSDTETPKFSFIQLHNYRRVFDFSTNLYQPPTNPLKIKKVGFYKGNHGQEDFYKDFHDCSIRVRKKTIQITNKIDHKRWHSVDMYRPYDIIKKIVEAKEYETVAVLKQFLGEFGGKTEFTLISHYQETKVKTNPITERLADNLTWHNEEHKKVYKDKVIEIYDINKAIQLIDNSIFFDNAEEIAAPLKVLANGVGQLLELPKSFEQLKSEIHTKQDAYRNKRHLQNLNDDDKYEMMKLLKKRIFGEGV